MASVFPVIFLGELPDKTMFASLVLASHGRPLAVWLGAASAFALHVAIAVTVGVVIFNLLPHRPVEAVVAALFLAGAAYSFAIRNQSGESADVATKRSALGASAAAGAVIFIAEWGDLTQILTANLAARYHSALNVGVAAVAALWAVAAIAVIGGTGLLRLVSVRALRITTAVVLVGLAVYTAVTAFAG